jgi:hypothetical protein
VGLERGSLSLVSTTEELFERKSRGSGVENRYYGRRGSAVLTTLHSSIRKTSPTSFGRSVVIVRSQTQATEFSFLLSQAQVSLLLCRPSCLGTSFSFGASMSWVSFVGTVSFQRVQRIVENGMYSLE